MIGWLYSDLLMVEDRVPRLWGSGFQGFMGHCGSHDPSHDSALALDYFGTWNFPASDTWHLAAGIFAKTGYQLGPGSIMTSHGFVYRNKHIAAVAMEEYTVTHYPDVIEYMLSDHPLLATNCPLDNGRHTLSPTHSLSRLSRLPRELLHMILTQLDLCTLTNFRMVNQNAMALVDSLPAYVAITTHGLTALRAILALETGRFITCQSLYDALRNPSCTTCHRFAGYLYLLTCRRTCYLCLITKLAYYPLTADHVYSLFGLSEKQIEPLPCMKTLPGEYATGKSYIPGRMVLYDPDAVERTSVALHGSLEAMQKFKDEVVSSRYRDLMRQALGIDVSLTTIRMIRAPCLDLNVMHTMRFVGVARVPVLVDVKEGVVEWGVHCVACKEWKMEERRHWRQLFTREGFEEHLREFGEIKEGRHVGEGRGEGGLSF
ncbi:hypothetical protein GX50_02065 [[Emmonsia] crescens]|uniref:F-box domain-containing protein n=1 Tax=[Emmonsia] crescens TaxID=73230 RepID=A0A2B7ZPM8_9EURO|nr:hypothetical protein GX50_02065 [Emmonsia crescens]